MTHLLYYDDAYIQEFDATVVAVEGDRVALDRTAFYPGGGGQPNDTGWLEADGQRLVVDQSQERGRQRLALAGSGRRARR
jgi:Ser-tRNA(Ala) deacylase AlaX